MIDVLLTDKEEQTVFGEYLNRSITDDTKWYEWLCRAQCLKLLDVMKKMEMVEHHWHPIWKPSKDGLRSTSKKCFTDCKLCEIGNLLKGGA